MEKIISLALALVMIFAVSIPAFSIDLGAGTPAGNTQVLVDGISDMGEGSYTVTIPAEIQIPWGNITADVEYSIWCQLQTGKRVKVTASSADGGVMKNASQTATLDYSLSDTTYTTTKSVVLASAPETDAVKVNIEQTEWESASIDNYSGTLTFTAELI